MNGTGMAGATTTIQELGTASEDNAWPNRLRSTNGAGMAGATATIQELRTASEDNAWPNRLRSTNGAGMAGATRHHHSRTWRQLAIKKGRRLQTRAGVLK